MVTLKYRVHGISVASRPVKVTFQGEEIDAMVESFEVELVTTDDPTHGSTIWRFVGADAKAAREVFKDGALGTLTWTPETGSDPKAGAHAPPPITVPIHPRG